MHYNLRHSLRMSKVWLMANEGRDTNQKVLFLKHCQIQIGEDNACMGRNF